METYYMSFVTELFIALSDQLKECQVTEPLQIAIAELAIQRVGEMRKVGLALPFLPCWGDNVLPGGHKSLLVMGG